MPTTVLHDDPHTLRELLGEHFQTSGEFVIPVVARPGARRPIVSQLRSGPQANFPSLEVFVKIIHCAGPDIVLTKS